MRCLIVASNFFLSAFNKFHSCKDGIIVIFLGFAESSTWIVVLDPVLMYKQHPIHNSCFILPNIPVIYVYLIYVIFPEHCHFYYNEGRSVSFHLHDLLGI